MPSTKLRRMSRPAGVWTTSGWNWMPYIFRAGSARPAYGDDGELASGHESVGRADDLVAVAHPHVLLRLNAAEQPVLGGDRDGCRPVLALLGRNHVATQVVRHQLDAVADAQHRDVGGGPDRWVRVRRAVLVDAHRAAGQDDGARLAGEDLLPRRIERDQLRVDVQLADAAGNQLRRLTAEIDDDHVVRSLRLFVLGADRWRRVERNLEICLDLGIVRGKDTVAGVGGLAMDCLAALSSVDLIPSGV